MITRFPPSPTGFLHVGSLRTALFAYLAARKAGGKFVLRIEDTDRERLVEGATESIVRTLEWAGITVDEGVTLGADGKITPESDHYIQSKRKEAGIYQEHIQMLLDTGAAYYAFDTPEELEAMRNAQEEQKLPPRYDRMKMTNQLTLSPEETKKRVASGDRYVIRLKMPESGVTAWDDLIRGHIEFQNALIDDQILLKSDGFPTYHFAVVVDDHLMGVTHVIRGDEWLSSVPKHITIYQAFGWDLPVFAHLSLLVNAQKQKLSKRHGDVAVEDFKEKGYLPEALVNFVAMLGWNPGTEQEIFSLKELEQAFTLEKVGVSPSVFDYAKLDWYNKQYIMALAPTDLATRALPFFKNAGVALGDFSPDQIATIVAMEQGRAATLVELVENVGFVFASELVYEPELLIWKKSDKETTKKYLLELEHFLGSYEGVWSREPLETVTLEWIASKGYSNGDVLWPLRVALSGKKNSPGPLEIAGVLGKERTLSRLHTSIKVL